MMTIWFRWFLSRTVREASLMWRFVRRLIQEQRDLISPEAIGHVGKAIDDLRAGVIAGADEKQIREKMGELEACAQKWLKAYPNASARENFMEFQSTAVKILAIFCFFFQPMAIPSGSAQPTLFGITHSNLKGVPGADLPSWPRRLFMSFFQGIHYYRVEARTDGELRAVEPPKTLLPLVKRQRLLIGDVWHTVWFPTDDLAARAGLSLGERYRRGDEVLKLRVISGDHLFVNRYIYNFRRPQRGETIVFVSTGVEHLIQNTHYIKRLVALGGEHVRIGNDRHLIINGERLDASTPGFENVYSFNGPPRDSVYSGHVNDAVGRQYVRPGISLAPLFPTEDKEFVVRPKHYLVMGDNTMNSHDGRAWGDFPEEKVIGRASFVFWPISSRFGFGYR